MAYTEEVMTEKRLESADKQDLRPTPSYQTNSYVITREWVSAGFDERIEDKVENIGKWAGATAGALKGATWGSSFGPVGTVMGGLFGGLLGSFAGKKATELVVHTFHFDGLGEYNQTVEFDFLQNEYWGKHYLEQFYEKNEQLKKYFSYGYRMDGYYQSNDSDQDGLTDVQERHIGTRVGVEDTDGDGFSDVLEVKLGGDPLTADHKPNLNFMIDEQDKTFLAITGTEEADTGKLLQATAVEMRAEVDVEHGKIVYTPVADGETTLPMNQMDWERWLAAGSKVIQGTDENDLINTGLSVGTFKGSDACEIIWGGAGDDVIALGKGGDIVLGGKGADTFALNTDSISHQPSLIADFSAEDKLDLNGLREWFADHQSDWQWADLLRDTINPSGQSALVWNAPQHLLSYQASNSTNLTTLVRFQENVDMNMIANALVA